MEVKEGMEKVDIVLVECKRCGHKWIPRVPIVRICPRCKSPYWNVEKTRFFNNNNNSNKNSKSKSKKKPEDVNNQ